MMKKFILSSLACMIASHTFAATETQQIPKTAIKSSNKTTASSIASSSKPTSSPKQKNTIATKTSTKSADDKAKIASSTTGYKLPASSPTKTSESKATSQSIPASSTSSSNMSVASTASATASAPLTPIATTPAALGLAPTSDTASAPMANQNELDNDYTSGAGVAGANSEVVTDNSTQPATFDPTAIGNNKAPTSTNFTNLNLSDYAQKVNTAEWKPGQNVNSATTLKLQALLDWNHASPGPIDGGWGMNAKKALKNFQAMNGLPQDGRMSQQVWNLLNKNIPKTQPVLVGYTLTQADVDGPYQATPSGSEAKSKMKGLYYQNIQEMLAERFHMDIRYLKKLNANRNYTVGETVTVFNPGNPLNEKITRIVAKKSENVLYAYNGDKLIATYPTTVGSTDTPSPTGSLTIVNRVKNPWYKATQGEGKDKKVFMLPPGPNGPVGVVWMGLSKPSYGIHGSPMPEGISRQASHGCVRLTNWDVLEVYANVDTGTKVELQ